MGKRGQGTTVNAGGLSRTGQYRGGGRELSKGRHPVGVRLDFDIKNWLPILLSQHEGY